jgi:peptidoglycan/LPS O-acetylase OafA/YrhL
VDGVSEPRSSRHLWDIDLIRLMTFTAVISVHSLAFTQQPANEVAAAFMMLLQFGREVFFAITGFVLVYSAIGKPVRALSFWRKRIPYVAVPYIVWSSIYFGQKVITSNSGVWDWGTFGHDLIYGGAEYHLYFLVVTLQLYVVFPFILRFVRATAAHAGAILIVVGLANLAWLGCLQYGHFHGWVFARAYELLPTYTVYVLAGAYGALHRERIQAFLVSHLRALLGVAAGATAVAFSIYGYQLGWMPARGANAVTQPAEFLCCVAAVIVMGAIAQRWVSRGKKGLAAVKIGSEISFGVYLSHPLVLQVLLDHGLGSGNQSIPSPLATVLGLFGAIVGASALCLAVRRTPLALLLIGRPRARTRAFRLRSTTAAPAIPGTPSRPGAGDEASLTQVSADGNRPLISQG